MVLTKYRLAKLRELLREEAGVLDATSARLKDLCLSIPAPDLEELRALEAGEDPLSIEAVWISLLSEHSFLADESAQALRFVADLNRAHLKEDWWSGFRPDAKLIAHLRSGLRGRTGGLPSGARKSRSLRPPTRSELHIRGRRRNGHRSSAEGVSVGWVMATHPTVVEDCESTTSSPQAVRVIQARAFLHLQELQSPKSSERIGHSLTKEPALA